jgi:hypothetical protein
MTGASARALEQAVRPEVAVDVETRIFAAAVGLGGLRLLVAAAAVNGGLRRTGEPAAVLLLVPRLGVAPPA